MTNKFVIKKTPLGIKERGLFAQRDFETNDVVLKFEGKPISKKELDKDYTKEEQAFVLQVGADIYLDLKGEPTYFINHSCNPNCKIVIAVNNAFLIALRPITADDQLFFDYSLSSTDTPEDWIMKCACDRFACRKDISGFNHMPNKIKEEFIEKKMVPRYILNNE